MPEDSTPVLIIRDEWLQKIMRHEKTVEIRGRATRTRGRIGLSASGAQTVVATVEITDCEGPLDAARFEELADYHCIPVPTPVTLTSALTTITDSDYGMAAASMDAAEKIPPPIVSHALPYRSTYAYHLHDPRWLDAPRTCPRNNCVVWARYRGDLS